jgi:hypothetical protein
MSRVLLSFAVAASVLLIAGAAWGQCCGGQVPTAQAPQATADAGATVVTQKICPPGCTKQCCAQATTTRTAARWGVEHKAGAAQGGGRTSHQRTVRQCVILRLAQAERGSVSSWPYWDSYRPHQAW